MRRTLALVATLAVAIVGLGALAAPAGAAAAVNVTPSTNIDDGTTVTVSWTGFAPNGTPSIVQCKNAPATGAGGSDCEFLTLQVSADGSNASGAGSDTFVVHDTNGLALLNDRTEVKCDTATSGAILVVDNPNDPASGAYKTITCTGSSTVTLTPNIALSCSGLRQIATLNPTMGSRSAKYVKAAGKDSVGDRTEFGSGTPIPADGYGCSVDPGVRNEIPGSDSTKPNPFDNQTNGQTSLTTSGALAKTTLGLQGSTTCQTEAQGTVNNTDPQAYPLQGKLITKFDQTDALGKQIQLQAYVHLGRDTADTDPSHWKLGGVVIKGPGIGGEIDATVALVPTGSVKNLNAGECTDADVTDDTDDATIAEMAITLADGSDQDGAVDPLTVTLPS